MALILQILWLFLPAGIANMSPVLFRRVPFGNYPVDFGTTMGGKPLLGTNKTFRGLLFGILASVAFVHIQRALYPLMAPYSLVDYSAVNPWVLGILLGAGALLGDIVKSFFKRRVDIVAGSSWVPFDQIDWIVGAILAVSPIIALDVPAVLIAVAMFGVLHAIVNLVGYALKLKTNKF